MAGDCVLVAGVNYPDYPSGRDRRIHATRGGFERRLIPLSPGNWRSYCERRAELMFKKDPQLSITIFDFHTGEVLRREGVSTKWEVETKYDALKDHSADYRIVVGSNDPTTARLVAPSSPLFTEDKGAVELFYFSGASELGRDVYVKQYGNVFYKGVRRPKDNSLSIAHVYECLDKIGQQRHGALKEFHVFSHGYVKGPILVNSLDLENGHRDPNTGKLIEAKRRDRYDRDGRPVDFRPGGIINVNLESVRAAFAKEGFSFIWGCAKTTLAHALIKQTTRELIQKKERTTAFVYLGERNWGGKQLFDAVFGTEETETTTKPYTLEEAFGVLRRMIDLHYGQGLANATGRPVLAAFPGTASNYDEAGAREQQFLHVSMGDTSNGDDAQDDYRFIMNFYRRYLGIRFDTSEGRSSTYGRGYGIHQPR